MSRRLSKLRVLLILLILLAAIAAPDMMQGYGDLARAESAYGRQEYAQAAPSYASAARLLPWKPGLFETAGIAYASAGDWQHAMPLLRQARLRGALTANGWDVLGTGYWLESDNSRALEVWTAGLQRYQGETKFFARLALAYRGLGDYNAERQALEKWLVSGDGAAAEHYRLGELIMDSDAVRAKQELRRAAEMDKVFEPAAETLEASLDLAARQAAPSQRLVIVGRGLGLVDDWALAKRAFSEATQQDAANAEAWAWLGEARQHIGQEGNAELERALSLNPADTSVRALRGLYWKRLGNPAAMLVEYQKAAELDPKNAEWQASLGEAYSLSGDLVSALAAYQKATELAPQNADYWRLLAMFCSNNSVRVLDVGLPAAKRGAELAPHDALVLDALGWSYAQAGLLYSAEETLQKVTKQAPELAVARLHLGETYLRKGDEASALAELKLARNLDPDGATGALAGQLIQQYFP